MANTTASGFGCSSLIERATASCFNLMMKFGTSIPCS